MNTVQYVTIEDEVGQRLDNFLLRILKGVPKSHIYRLIREGQVRVNKKRAQPATRLNQSDIVRIPPIRTSTAGKAPIDAKLADYLAKTILYENDQFMVLNKPAGVAVHGGSGVSFGVIEALRHQRKDLSYLELVHRLDKETSGCLLIALKRSALRELQALFAARHVEKQYWALLHGRWSGAKVRHVRAPLFKHTLPSGERMVRVDEALGKASETRFRLLANAHAHSFVEAFPKTGRTHQIRVHSVSLGHPLVGDDKYITALSAQNDTAALSMTRLCLHARSIQFTLGGEAYRFVAALDERFTKMLHQLGMEDAVTESTSSLSSGGV